MAITIGIRIPSRGASAREALYSVLLALIALDLRFLRENPSTPLLALSGVRYSREPPGHEFWQTIPDILLSRTADCEDLSSWRVAEARYRGYQAAPRLTEKNGMWHVTAAILLPKSARWTITDPSRETGM